MVRKQTNFCFSCLLCPQNLHSVLPPLPPAFGVHWDHLLFLVSHRERGLLVCCFLHLLFVSLVICSLVLVGFVLFGVFWVGCFCGVCFVLGFLFCFISFFSSLFPGSFICSYFPYRCLKLLELVSKAATILLWLLRLSQPKASGLPMRKTLGGCIGHAFTLTS